MNINITKETTACFTGHRPVKLPWGYNEKKENCLKFKADLYNILRNAILFGIENFITGMAEGFDMIAAETVLKLKKEFPHVKLIAAIPCKGQEERWGLSQQERYHNILKRCDDAIVLAERYYDGCMNDRNLYMAKHSGFCIACWDGLPSGTANTIRLAQQNGCKVRLINPNDYK